jgi:putative ABC transport system permease protein
MKYLYLVWTALTRRKLRTFLTLVSVVVAFLLFGLLESVSSVISQAGNSIAAAHRLITVSSMLLPLPISLGGEIPSVAGVQEVTYGTPFAGVYQRPSNPIAGAAVARNYFDLFPELKVSPAARRAFDSTLTGAIAGTALAQRYHWTIGEQVPITMKLFPRKNGSDTWTFDLVGTYRGRSSAQEQVLFVRWRGFDLGRDFDKSTVAWYWEKIAYPDEAGRIAARVDALSANSGHETKTQTESGFIASLIGQVVSLGLIVHAVMGAVFFTLILLAGNTMAQAVRERIPELAILKTVGFSNRRVLGLVLAESVLLVGVGGIGGLTLAMGVQHALQARLGAQLPMMPVGAAIWLWGLAAMILIGLVVGALPARRGMRLRIVDALAGR